MQRSRVNFVKLWLLDTLIVKQEVCCVKVLLISTYYQVKQSRLDTHSSDICLK